MTFTNTTRKTLLVGLMAVLAFTTPVQGQLPNPGMEIDPANTALVITDPQNDFLSPDGVTWGVVGKSVTENNTVENIESLLKAAKANDIPVFVSPHYYYPTDHGWKFEGALEAFMHAVGMFDREDALSLDGFENSGADWLERYKPYIKDGKTVVSSPHKVYGPETNDLILQLRKRGIDRVVLAGMSANLCTESHLRELLEQGFEVAVVSDATAAAQVPDGDGYQSALVNFRFIANTVWTTAEALERIERTTTDARAAAQPSSAATFVQTSGRETKPEMTSQSTSGRTHHRTMDIGGLEIFYREAGPVEAPTVLLLHGFPTSSHMFRNLIPLLADRFHVIAPDYPGFGASSMPTPQEFDYTFDNLADVVDQLVTRLGIEKYSIYLMDYGAPVGYRLAVQHPERVQALIIQNGNAYDEGLREFWDPIKAYWKDRTPEQGEALRDALLTLEATKWQYTNGVREVAAISPDNWFHDQFLLERPGNKDIQLELFYDYGSNPPLYPEWQAYFREHQPPALIVWGKNDYIFPSEGASPYTRDLDDVELHLFDTGHFALEEDGAAIADLIRDFLERKVVEQGTDSKLASTQTVAKGLR